MMVLAAFRSKEDEATHLLTDGIFYFTDKGANLTLLKLGPLEFNAISRLLADTLDVSANDVQELAEVTIRKTIGNPFFVKEFISMVHEVGLVEFDLDTHRWKWNAEKIDEMSVTDNVVDLLSSRIGSLDKQTINVLSVGASIGSTFSVNTVAKVTGITNEVAARLLAPALTEQFIYAKKEPVLMSIGESDEGEMFSFSHDRIQHMI